MKELLMIRHGELENPQGMVYNRDSVMKSEDIIHLSMKGRAQFPPLAHEMQKQNKIPSLLWSSPETRAQESATILQAELGITHITTEPNLDDVYAPGPYLEGMTMKELEAIGGDVYDKARWGKYYHETPEAITTRMMGVVIKMVDALKDGQIGAIVSHGDPIAFLLNYLKDTKVPNARTLRTKIYPLKGSATLLRFDLANHFVSMRPFGGAELRRGSSY